MTLISKEELEAGRLRYEQKQLAKTTPAGLRLRLVSCTYREPKRNGNAESNKIIDRIALFGQKRPKHQPNREKRKSSFTTTGEPLERL